MNSERHVVIVGAGIVGLSCAEALVSRGYKVTVLEQDAEPGQGCSYGNGGIVVPSHFVPLAAPGMLGAGLKMMFDRRSPFGIDGLSDPYLIGWLARFARSSTKAHVVRSAPLLRDLHLASRRGYEELIPRLDADVGYGQRGLLILSRTKEGHEEETRLAEEANRLGLQATVLTPSETAKLEPDVRMDIAGAVHFQDDAHLTPPAYMSALRAHLIRQGVTIRDDAEVCEFRLSGNRLSAAVLAEDQQEGTDFVMAAGARSGCLARTLGLRLPLVAGRGHGFTVATPPQRPQIPAILSEARVAVTPMVDGVRFVGTMELARPARAESTPTGNERLEGMRRAIAQFYPAYQPQDLDVPAWCGERPCSPDGLPYIGRTSKAENLMIATGHAMMGMSLGPVTGQLIAELVANEPPSYPLELLSPDRYA